VSGLLRWRGFMAPLDFPSVDGRVIASPHPEPVRYRELPLPLTGRLPGEEKHVERVGSIEEVWVQHSCIMARGTIDPLLFPTTTGRSWPVGVDLDGAGRGGPDWSEDRVLVNGRLVDVLVVRAWVLAGAQVYRQGTSAPAFPFARIIVMGEP
jgi:hypothetical protein